MQELNKKSILVAYASTGSGHKIAAEAIAKALKNFEINVDVNLVDILDYFPQNESGSKFVSRVNGFLSPAFDMSWRLNFTGRIVWGGGQLWPSFVYKNFETYLADADPNVVVCTHFVCANAAAKCRVKHNKNFQIISVPTDYETEGLWPHRETDLFCVANEEMASTLISRRVPASKILISGIPVASEFEQKYFKQETLKVFSIPSNKNVALVICGAKESGPYKNMRKVLNDSIKFLANMDWMHFVFCTGDDLDYANTLMKLANKVGASNFTILNYTDKLAALMAASDIAIIKAGGLVVSECVSQNLPMLIIGKSYAQENMNRRYLVSNGAAEHATTYKGLVNLLCDIFTYPNWYKKLKYGVSSIKYNNSSEIIAKESILRLNESHSEKAKIWNNLYIANNPIHSR